RTDHDGIGDGAQAMQMGDAFRPVDVARMARWRRDATVERLADLTDHEGPATGRWSQGAEQAFPRIAERLARPEAVRHLGPCAARVEDYILHCSANYRMANTTPVLPIFPQSSLRDSDEDD